MRCSRLATAAAAVALVAGSGGLAHADTRSFPDDTATPGAMDIERVTVRNEGRLTIRIKVDDLQRRFGRSASAWLDTNRNRRGPEFFIGSGLYQSDWQITRVRGWRLSGEPLACPIDQHLGFRRDVIRWTTGRACLGAYSAVRVSVETQRNATRDFSPARHRFFPRVARN